MKSLTAQIQHLGFDPYEMEYDSQLRRLLQRSAAVRPDAHVAEELWLPSGRCRADVAVASDELVGFEIKAGRDRLDRLPGQIAEYDSQFRFSNIVTVPKHLAQVERLLPGHWGVWIALGEGRRLRLRCLRRASAHLERDGTQVARLLNCDECLAKLRALGLGKGASKLSKADLAEKVGLALTLRELDRYICECLKLRSGQPKGTTPSVLHVPAHEAPIAEPKTIFLNLGHLVHTSVLSDTHVALAATRDGGVIGNAAPAKDDDAARLKLQRLRIELREAANRWFDSL